MKNLRIALAQMNPTVGDLSGNAEKISKQIAAAREAGASIVAFPELALTGYPPEDLLLKPRFIEENLKVISELAGETHGIVAVIGFVDRMDDIYNAAAIMSEGSRVDTYHKIYLPNYGVFDEYRYFQVGARVPVYTLGETLIGVNICEDIWYPDGPAHLQALAGAELIININSSPFSIGKRQRRERMLATRAADSAAIVAHLNTVGGQDELVFDGGSVVLDATGTVVARAPVFKEDLMVVDLDLDGVFMQRLRDPRRRREARKLRDERLSRITIPFKPPTACPTPRRLGSTEENLPPDSHEEVYEALSTGIRDYVRKNGFKGVVIGLSGGVDSALVATLAVDALGAENVTCLFMPSQYSSKESLEDARQLAENLGVAYREISIQKIYESYLGALEEEFRGLEADETEENLQARARGNILMALSNKYNLLVLTTGNKSEMSVGYATLYGDMAGGFAAIKDVPKTLVFDLCRWKNSRVPDAPPIPERIIEKPPSAELRPDQKDTDSLPPYDVLDPILKAYIEDERNFEEILSMGCETEQARRIIRLIDLSEYKRRQSPPGIKITQRSFGRERRFPITNGFRSY